MSIFARARRPTGSALPAAGWVDVGPDPVPRPGDRVVAELDGLGPRVLVVRTRRGVFVCESRCPHRGCALDEAKVGAWTITCPEHGWQFLRSTGECTAGTARLRVWPATVVGGRLYVRAGGRPRVSA